jgi:hypothetical protein
MAIPRWVSAPIGRAMQTVGAYNDLVTPGTGSSTVTNAGRSITDRNQVYTGGLPFDGNPSFTQVAGLNTGGGAPSQPGGNGGQIDSAPISNNGGYWVGGQNYGSAGNYQASQVNQTNAMLDDQTSKTQRLLGSLGTQKQQGLQKLSDSYNTEKLAGELQYGQQVEDNTRQKLSAFNKVDTNARTAYNSLKRLLGLSGGPNQSALKFAAPDAIARVASQERGDQVENYALNDRNIENAKTSFLQDLLNKKNERESDFLKGIMSQEQSINSDLGDIAAQRAQVNGGNYEAIRAARSPFQNVINQRQSDIDNLFNQYNTPFNANKTLATLNQFNVDKAAINANKASGGEEYSPYAQPLRKKLQQDYV